MPLPNAWPGRPHHRRAPWLSRACSRPTKLKRRAWLRAPRAPPTTPCQLPVNIKGNIQDLLIELPDLDHGNRKLVVVPTERHAISNREYTTGEPRRRYDFSWTCIVVASTHPDYPVGCWRLSFPEYQLKRGTQRTLAL